jgi:spore maturation protein CgeB
MVNLSTRLRVTVVGRAGTLDLDGSYGRALAALGCDVDFYDLAGVLASHTRLSRLGRYLTTYVPVETWARKANRDFFMYTRERRPELIVIIGSAPIRAGALAQIKLSNPATKVALIWPDPLTSLERHTMESFPICDVVGTFSRESVPLMLRLGANKACWLPFAVDFDVHPPDVERGESDQAQFGCDVLFVGGYRREREDAILALVDAGLHVKVYGTDLWLRDARDARRARGYWQGKPLFGADIVRASRCAAVSLNVMDAGAYPGANMRFFETFATGVASVNSECPEFAEEFVDREATAYFRDPESLVPTVQSLLRDDELRRRMGRRGMEIATASHTYRHRAQTLLNALDLGATLPTG